MIRAIFWLVLLINLIFFALMKWGGALTRDDASLLSQPPLNPEKIKLLAASAVAASSSVAAAASASPPVQPAPPQPVQPAVPSPVPAVPAPAACLEWGEFSGTDLSHATANLGALKLGNNLSQRQVEHTSGYWVYIPPQKSHAETNKKIAQLKKLGIKQYFVVQEKGKWHNAISLGVFKSAELTQKFLAQLKSKGIKSAMAGERQTKLKLTLFTLRNPDAETLSKLVEWQKDFSGIEMKAVSCN